MRVVVDLTKCQGYGQCAFLAPSTFVMDGEEGLHFVAEPPEGERERVLRAAAACPVQAIAMELSAKASRWRGRRKGPMQALSRAESSSSAPRWPGCWRRRPCSPRGMRGR